MAATSNSCFWLADFLKSSPLKPLSQMKWNLVGSIYGRSSLKIAHFVPIYYQTWPPETILVADWPIFCSPGHRPCELLSWLSVCRPSISFSHLNLLWNHWTELNQSCHKCSLDGLPDLCLWSCTKLVNRLPIGNSRSPPWLDLILT